MASSLRPRPPRPRPVSGSLRRARQLRCAPDVQVDARRVQRPGRGLAYRRLRLDPPQPVAQPLQQPPPRPRAVETRRPAGPVAVAGRLEPRLAPPASCAGAAAATSSDVRSSRPRTVEVRPSPTKPARASRVAERRARRPRRRPRRPPAPDGPAAARAIRCHRLRVAESDDAVRVGVPERVASGETLRQTRPEGLRPLRGVEGPAEVQQPRERQRVVALRRRRPRRRPRSAGGGPPGAQGQETRRALRVRGEDDPRLGLGQHARPGPRRRRRARCRPRRPRSPIAAKSADAATARTAGRRRRRGVPGSRPRCSRAIERHPDHQPVELPVGHGLERPVRRPAQDRASRTWWRMPMS